MGTFKGRIVSIAILAATAGFALTGCNDTAFTAFTATADGTILGQRDAPCNVGTSKKDLRIMFMVDDSGSTNTTDPSKKYRVQTLQQFIHDYGGNSNLSYTFSYFSGITAMEFDMTSRAFTQRLAADPVGNSGELSTALLSYEALKSDGNTPYKAAFTSLADTVRADENAGNKQDYVVVFMSDGQPTDISGAANLNALVTSLKTAAAANGSDLLLSTVYFGPATDTASIANLSGMAKAGGGQFVDTNKLAAGGLVINDIISVPGCQSSAVAAKSTALTRAPSLLTTR